MKHFVNIELRDKSEKGLRVLMDEIFNSSKVCVKDVTETKYSTLGEYYYCEFNIQTEIKNECTFLRQLNIDRKNILFF